MHRKGAKDAKRAKLFTKLAREITVAAKMGLPDPAYNARLRTAINDAKAESMPKDNIERAIKKGTGELEGVNYEELVYEGVGPGGALFLIEVMTDNRNRTAGEVRKIFTTYNGQLGGSGSAAWAFEQKGILKLPAGAATEEQLFEVAVGAGADDIEQAGEEWVIKTKRDDLYSVREALSGAGLQPTESQLSMVAKTPKVVDGANAQSLMGLFEALDDHDDVQNVYSDFELSESALAQLAQA